ncbi:TBC1 domain family member 12 isoform X1 [Megalops cyprinoides]|uniref:TBC1 domain family member 12 isoform X1 n=1 Tax=Megalops cyprinoides TaxID=118141 RepID=UPI0018641DB8|nr:TBC1 domain family member 12 isoform X1 [Megalops cyprinoides]
MEKAENGASQPALSIDVNENEETNKPHTALSDCSTAAPTHLLRINKNQAFAEDNRKSGEIAKGYVCVVNRRNVNVDADVLPSRCGGSGDRRMLDFVTDCLPGGIKDNCVISELCSDATLNGFTESSGGLMVGSKAGGGGREGTPSCSASVTAGQQEMNGMLLDGISQRAGGAESTPDSRDKGCLKPETMLQCTALPSLSCDGRHEQNCTCTASPPVTVKLSNGDMDSVQQGAYGSEYSVSETVERPSFACKAPGASEKEAKAANGGELIVNRADANLHCCPADTDAVTCNPHIKNTPSSPAPCDTDIEGTCRVREEPIPGEVQHTTLVSDGVSSEPSARNSSSSPPQPEDSKSHGSETESSSNEEHQSKGAPSRPLTLRTHPNSTVSLSCDSTPLSPEDGDMFGAEGHHDLRFMDVSLSSRNTFEASRRQSAPDNIPDATGDSETCDQGLKPKKQGISDFFGRSLFSRKSKDPKPPSQSVPGWKLFGKVPLRENPPKDSKTIQQDSNPGNLTSVSTPNLLSTGEYEARMGKTASPAAPPQQGRRKNLEFEPLSTTALILEDRPANLPAKSAEEAQRHRQEYDEMVAEAKKREMKEAQRKKRQMKERFKQEEIIANAMVIWNTEILPNWESMRNTRRVRDLWWQGLPPSVRGKVWSLAIGNELNITHELYEIFLSRAKERWRSLSETSSETEAEDSGASLADRESSLDLIKLDISRTFPSLFIFQKGGPYHDLLHSVLGAYTCYRPDVGYVQGMSFIAAVLILNLEEADAFIAFANLLNKPCQMAFFRVDHDLMLKYFAAFEVFFEENLPRLFNHFQSYNLTPDLYLIDWIFTLYSKSLPLDLACRVWDVFCRDGEEYLFRTGLGILRLYEEVLLQMDFIHIAQFLTRLPEDMACERLFSCIAAIQMVSSNKKWTQVFSALMKDNKDLDKNNSPALKS